LPGYLSPLSTGYYGYVARRFGAGIELPAKFKSEPDYHGKLIVSKRGVYMVRGGRKLKSVQLIPWEQFLGSVRSL
jgi:hypothetical protein